MTESADVEQKLLHLLNVMVAYSGFARQDAALATAHEGLTLSRSFGLVDWEFVFILQMCRTYDPVLFPADYERHVQQLVDLLAGYVDRLAVVEEYSYIAPMIDGILARLADPLRTELSHRFAKVRDKYNRASLQELAVMAPAAANWSPEFTALYEVLAVHALADQVPAQYQRVDLRKLHKRLWEEVRRTRMSTGVRRTVLADLHRLTMIAGLRADDYGAVLDGAKGMLKAPGLPAYRADRTNAAQIILWTMAAAMPDGGQANIPRIYRTATLQAIRKVAWEGLRAVYGHRISRFAVANLAEMYPLISAYVDFLAERPATRRQAMEMIAMYQGAAVSIASRLATDPDQRPEGFDFFGYDLDSLLRYHVRSGPTVAEVDADVPMLLRKSPVLAALTSTATPDSGFAEVDFRITDMVEKPEPAVTVADAHRLAQPGVAIISLFLTERWLYAMVVHTGGRPRLRRLCGRSELAHASRPLIASLRTSRERFLLGPEDFAWLHDLVTGPALADLPPAIDRLVLLSQQIQLPLHLAYDSARARYLIDDYSITYAHSIDSYIRYARRPSIRTGSALLLDGSAATGQVLMHVTTELLSISEALAHSFQVNGPHRARAAIQPAGEPLTVAHYSGHMQTTDDGTRWQMQLEDGFITPGELIGRLGERTEIVSLFSCFSADQQGAGPEPVGISTLLAAAGARNFVGCLWSIPDVVAADIASTLYTRWTATQASVPDITRQAMLAHRSRPPGVWGSVVCYGPHDSPTN